MKSMIGKLAAAFTMAALHITSWLPLRLSQGVGKFIGAITYTFNTRLAKVTRENVRLCFPELSADDQQALIRDSLRQTGQTLMETPATWLARSSRLNRWICNLEGEDILDNAVAEGNGVIIVLPHMGNWELFNVYFARRGKMTALYSPPRQNYLVEVMRDIRNRFGNELVPTNVKGIATLYRRLNEGQVVTILPDQVPRTGVYAPFFGVQALTDNLVSRLLQKTHARVVCAYVRRREDESGFDVVFREPVEDIYSNDLVTSAAALNKTVEACVEDAPAQYQWEYKRFKERPSGERKLYRFNRPEGFH